MDAETADQMIETLAAFVDNDVLPNVRDFELDDLYPDAMVDQMQAFGLFGATIPQEYGGLGLDYSTYARVIEELSRGWMSLAGVINSHLIAAQLVNRFGTEDQRKRLLPEMAAGTRRGCFSLSEPDSGSDAAALRCKARKDGNEWVINGTKMWVTNGERASVVALLARTTEDDISCFMVEKTPGPDGDGGISISKHIDKLGYRGLETVEMSYVDHHIPENALLGGEDGLGQGFRWALAALELGRINVAARGVGVAQAAFDAALDYAQQREAFGRPIAHHQAIGFKLAEMATKLHAARLMVADAARRADNGERADMEAGMAKLFASETAAELALEAMRIHGGNGFTTEYSVERLYRDAPLMIIGEGTSEIQKMVISRTLLARAAEGR
ncbi:MAG: alkylation response protein AidB-like acyl-CoA dehydrogenase [Acidimicrobiales bacterium]|jgi:alkylation response protein AidB-like acyl-CoA dehydrogenase